MSKNLEFRVVSFMDDPYASRQKKVFFMDPLMGEMSITHGKKGTRARLMHLNDAI